MNLSKINQEVLDALRRREFSDVEIEEMDARKAFHEYCNWNSLSGWGSTLICVIDNLREAAEVNP